MREQYVGSHKYGGDAFATYLDTLEPDETFGDVDEYGRFFARYGRHVLITDSLGFVTREEMDDSEWEDHWREHGEWMER